MRLDQKLVLDGFFESRNKAQNAIDKRLVKVNGMTVSKASAEVSESDIIETEKDPEDFVGRGGLKLQAAIDGFNVDVSGMVAVDIGASTGGFTECLLRHGALRVYAVDCGRGQLHPSLTADKRVISMEGFNARELRLEHIGEPAGIVTMDVSFISQIKLFPAVVSVLSENGIFISLVKPQFEVGKNNIGKNGIVKDKNAAEQALERVISEAALLGLENIGKMTSPVKGGDGNTEYLAVFQKRQQHEGE